MNMTPSRSPKTPSPGSTTAPRALIRMGPQRQVPPRPGAAAQLLSGMQHLEVPAGKLVLVALVQQDAPSLLERETFNSLEHLVIPLGPSVRETLERILRRILDHLLAG